MDNGYEIDMPTQKTKRTKCDSLAQGFLKLDQFKAQYRMNIDENGTSALPTYVGAIFSLLLTSMLTFFMVYKASYIYHKDGYQMMSTVKENFFQPHERFGLADDFAFAVALVDYMDLDGEPLDPSFATLEIIAREWGYNTDGSSYRRDKILDTHYCSQEELGLTKDSSNSKFMPLNTSSESTFRKTSSKYLCIKDEDYYINGNYDSDQAHHIRVHLKRCEGHESCKDRDEIDSKINKLFIILLSNRISFDSNRFGLESIVRESHI